MPYVTLLEASQIVSRETGIDITVLQLIRAGFVQNLPLCVLLDVKCYSPTHKIRNRKHAQETDPDYRKSWTSTTDTDAGTVEAYGLFVLPQRHIFAYQTKETVRIEYVSSLDGLDNYCPFVEVSRDALQITLLHLNAFITHIKTTQAAQQKTAPAPDTATPAPVGEVGALGGVEPDKAGQEDGLLTIEIAVTFDGVNGWNAERWRRNLSASKWLHPARTALGAAGGASSVWNPLTLAQLMHSKTKDDKARGLVMTAFNSRFTLNPVLMPWRADFNEYFATYCTTD